MVKNITKSVLVGVIGFCFVSPVMAMTDEEFLHELDKYNQRHLELTNFLNNAVEGQINKETVNQPVVLIKTCEIYINLLYTQKFAQNNGYDLYTNKSFINQFNIYSQAVGYLGGNEKYCSGIIGSRALNKIISNS